MSFMPVIVLLALSGSSDKNISDYNSIKTNAIKSLTDQKSAKECMEISKNYIFIKSILSNRDHNKEFFAKMISRDMGVIASLQVKEWGEYKNFFEKTHKLVEKETVNEDDIVEIKKINEYICSKFGRISFVSLKFTEAITQLLISNDTSNQHQLLIREMINPFLDSEFRTNPESYLLRYIKIGANFRNKTWANQLEEIDLANKMAKLIEYDRRWTDLLYYEAAIRYYLIAEDFQSAINAFKEVPKNYIEINDKNFLISCRFYKNISTVFFAIGDLENAVLIQKFLVDTLNKYKSNKYKFLVKNELAYLKFMCIRGKLTYELELLEKELGIKIEFNLEEADSLCEMGIQHLSKNEVNIAIQKLNESIKLNQFNPYAFEIRAKCYLVNGENQFAFNDFSKAIDLSHNSPELFYFRAGCLSFMEKYSLALLDASSAKTLNPKSFKFLYLSGSVNLKLNKLKEALNDLDRAISLNPSFLDSYTKRAETYFLLNENFKAIADLQKSLLFNKNDYSANLMYSRVLASLGRTEDAINNFKKCIQINDKKYEAYLYLSLIYSSLDSNDYKNKEEALYYALKGTEIQANKTSWLSSRAMAEALNFSGKLKEAIAWQEKCIFAIKADSNAQHKLLKDQEEILGLYKARLK